MTPVAEARRQAADISEEIQRLRTLATDAVDGGVHAARQAIKSVKRGVEQLEDLKEDAVHGMKRHPLKTAGIALGVGLVLGFAVGWIGRRPRQA